MSLSLMVNGIAYTADAEPETPLLWALRDHARADRHQVRLRHGPVRRLHCPYRRAGDAVLPRLGLGVAGKVTTIEGLSADGSHPVQRAWIEATCPSAATASRDRS